MDWRREVAAGDPSLWPLSSFARSPLLSLASSGVDSSDVRLDARCEPVERVEAGLELGVRVEAQLGLSKVPRSAMMGVSKLADATVSYAASPGVSLIEEERRTAKERCHEMMMSTKRSCMRVET